MVSVYITIRKLTGRIFLLLRPLFSLGALIFFFLLLICHDMLLNVSQSSFGPLCFFQFPQNMRIDKWPSFFLLERVCAQQSKSTFYLSLFCCLFVEHGLPYHTPQFQFQHCYEQSDGRAWWFVFIHIFS